MYIIVSMAKLLDAEWLRGVQLFHCTAEQSINDFHKTMHVFQQTELLQRN